MRYVRWHSTQSMPVPGALSISSRTAATNPLACVLVLHLSETRPNRSNTEYALADKVRHVSDPNQGVRIGYESRPSLSR
jgi:hypothetical protein